MTSADVAGSGSVPNRSAATHPLGRQGAAPHLAVSLRLMRPSDLRRVAALEVELFGVGAWTYGMLESELAGPSWYVVAVVPGTIPGADRVIGYAGLQFDGENADISTIGVAKEAQRWGVGSLLMDTLHEQAITLGAEAMFLDVAVNNDSAIAMYTKYGYQQIGLRKRYYQPENLDAYVMRLELETRDLSTTGLPADTVDPRSSVFITASELAAIIDEPATRVLDVRWQLGRADGREQHSLAHIPGAVYVDLDTELAVHASPEQGRHPLPTREAFAASARSWGVSAESNVVVYDAVGGTSASRLWWMLRNAGLTSVRILDGGISAWTGAGFVTESGEVAVAPSDIELSEDHMPTISIDEAEMWCEDGILIDARAAERYRGEVEPVDPRAGHIPGALNVPTFSHLNQDGTIKPRAQLLETFIDAGVIDPQIQGELEHEIALDRPIAAYCGSGVTASHEIAVLASLGIEAALFPGSWSQWSNDPTRTAETGE